MLADLSGKTALVTGGSQGIGRGIVLKLAEQGADVAIADINDAGAGTVVEEVKALGRKSFAVHMDVTDRASVEKGVKDVIEGFGHLDILVNNAGVSGAPGSTGTTWRDEDWDFTWKVNVKGLMWVTEAVIPHFKERKYGKIVNIASVAGRIARYATAYYGTTKGSVIQYTKACASEWAPYNVNVNGICPGRLWTQFWQDWMGNRAKQGDPALEGKSTEEAFMEAAADSIPLGRPQTPEDMGALAAFLCSEDAKNITGQSIQVDGGQVMV
jgi:NAD(P)-dependent dehydrogenase (short-subunit alcohol dehydrogenase family)